MKLLIVFLDSSVVLSGLRSPNGGSGMLFKASAAGKLKLIVSEHVVREVGKYLGKLEIDVNRFEILVEKKIIKVIADAADDLLDKFENVVEDIDDAPILAGAVVSGADFLVSLDKRHILRPEIKKRLRPMKVLPPREFWEYLRSK